jgi:hypothetical protein
MTWRKWVVRSLVSMVACALVAAGFAYQHWTNPVIVRMQVIANLEKHFPGVRVSLESAHLRLLGGISFRELRLSRRDDSDRTVFLYIPSGSIALDKEQLFSGQQVLGRIECYKPILHLICGPDGVWNVAGLAPPTPEIAIPILRLRDATVVVEDQRHRPDASPLEIRDVNLVLINDPHDPPTVSQLRFTGAGTVDLGGSVHVEGTLDRLSDAFSAALELPQFPVDGSLIQRLSKFCPEAAIHARQLTGTGKLQAEISFHPESPQPWRHKIRCQLTGGKLRHARIPFPLEDLDAAVRCVDGQVTLEHLTARSGATHFRLSGKASACHLDAESVEGRLQVDHLPITKELFAALPKRVQEIDEDYAPQGTCNLDIGFSCRGGQWQEHCTIRPENMAAVCAKFPYRLENISGRIEQELDPARSLDHLTVDLTGYAGSQPVFINGHVEGKKPASVNISIRAKDVPIDEQLITALEPEFQKLVHSFQPKGYADVEAYIRRAQGKRHFANEYVLHVHDACVTYEAFPYPLEQVSGTLTIQPDHWEYRDFQGTHKGAEFRSQGESVVTPQGKQALVQITGTNLALDAELRAALKRPAVETACQKLDLQGRMNCQARVIIPPGREEPDIDVIVTPLACTIKPDFFPYRLAELCGTVHYRKHAVELQKLRAHHGPTVLSLEKGNVSFHDDDSFSVALVNLQSNCIVPDEEFIHALPPALRETCTSLRLTEPLALLVANLTVSIPAGQGTPPKIHWDGGVRLKDATLLVGVPFTGVNGILWCNGEHHGDFGDVTGDLMLEQATVFSQTLRGIHSKIVVEAKQPSFLVFPNLDAHLYGGELGGAVRVGFGPTLGYEADLIGLHMELQEFSTSNHLGPKAQQSGLVDAHLHLQGQGSGWSGLHGWGSIDVPNGKMYNLPLLLDLLKFLSLHWPDGTFLEEAHVRFTVERQLVDISRIDLLGAAISLGGRGTVDLANSAYDMELYAVWGRIVQLSPSPIKEIWPAISENLLKIRMKGKLGETPRFEKVPVPGLSEPLQRVLERLAGRQSG